MDVTERPTRSTRSTAPNHDEEDNEEDVEMVEGQTESQRYRLNNDMPLEHFLTLQGITAGDLEKLRNVGYPTVRSVLESAAHCLEARSGFTSAKVSKLQTEARAQFPLTYTRASVLHKRTLELVRISTGSSQVNATINGGIRTGEITTLYGEAATGKTQLCHTLAIKCQLPVNQGGAEGKCIFIDTHGAFQADRIAEIAVASKVDLGWVLDNIIVMEAKTSDQIFEALAAAKVLMTKLRTALLIIDSATSLFRIEYPGRGQLHARQVRMNAMFGILRECISQQQIAVVLTAEIISLPLDNGMGPKKIMAGGNVIHHGSHTIFHMKPFNNEVKILKIFKSATLPVLEVKFQIGPQGVMDYIEPRRRNDPDA